jgi:hypothetical protein
MNNPNLRAYQSDLLTLLHKHGTAADWALINSALDGIADGAGLQNPGLQTAYATLRGDYSLPIPETRPAPRTNNRLPSLRLAILQTLSGQPGYKANEQVLRNALLRKHGYAESHDQLRAELAWLQVTQTLVCWASGRGATLTGLGLDAVNHVIVIPGICSPLPNEIETQ